MLSARIHTSLASKPTAGRSFVSGGSCTDRVASAHAVTAPVGLGKSLLPSHQLRLPPVCAVSRVVLIGVSPNPGFIIQNLLKTRIPTPIAVLALLYAFFAALMAAIRSHVVGRTKACKRCRGYGVQRCNICDATGYVKWDAKSTTTQPCPCCYTRRFVGCVECGGSYTRPLFAHVSAKPNPVLYALQTRTAEKKEPSKMSFVDALLQSD